MVMIDMDMPRFCPGCPMWYLSDKSGEERDYCNLSDKRIVIKDGKERPEWCELIDVGEGYCSLGNAEVDDGK